MKRVIAAVMAVGCMVFCLPALAHAEYRSYKCSEAPSEVAGNVVIGEKGESTCTISHGVKASGNIQINSEGSITVDGELNSEAEVAAVAGTATTIDGPINATQGIFVDSGTDTKIEGAIVVSGYGDVDFESGQSTEIESGITASHNVFMHSGENIKVNEEIRANTADESGDVLISAQNLVSTNTISTKGSKSYGVIEIRAQQNGSNEPFLVGGAGSNGVNGSLITTTATGNPDEPAFDAAGVYIENGTEASTGGIKVEKGSAINITATASKTGAIGLNAQNGKLTLPPEAISASGSPGYQAGNVYLRAKEVVASGGAIVTANQEASVAGDCHFVLISAAKISYGGTGLELTANGNGYSKTAECGRGSVDVLPQNSFDFSIEEPNISIHNERSTGSLSLSGTGALKVSANGNLDNVEIIGNELTLGSTNTSATTVSSNGNGNSVRIASEPFLGGEKNKLTLNAGPVTVEANGPSSESGEGGKIYIEGTVDTVKSSSFSATANGTSTGAGGMVRLSGTESSFSASVKGSVTANGGTSGNGGSVEWYPGKANVKLGTTSGYLEFAATGGSTEGNGGKIYVKPEGKVTVKGSSAVKVSASGKGSGGSLEILANELAFSGASTTVSANAKSKGNGGDITLGAYESGITLGTESGDVKLEAKGAGSGNGGTIIASGSSVKAASADISVAAGTTGSGGGIYLGGAPVSINGALNANAGSSGNGSGGIIQMNGKLPDGFEIGGNVENATGSNTTLSAIGYGTGKGGTISLNSYFTMKLGSGSTEFALKATAEGKGTGGTINLSSEEADINGGSLSVTSAKGNGGTIKVAETKTLKLAKSELEANGGEDGNGGEVSLTANAIDFEDEEATIKADGEGAGSGGHIMLESSESDPIILSEKIHINAEGGKEGEEGEGGSVSIEHANAASGEESLDIEGNVNVEPGNSEGEEGAVFPNTSGNASLVKHNGVTCYPFTTNKSWIWPKKYWNCISSMASYKGVSEAAHFPQSALLELLAKTKSSSNPTVKIYVMPSIESFEKFFNDPIGYPENLQVLGDTLLIHRASATFEKVLTSSGIIKAEEFVQSSSIMEYTIAHELGHELQYIWGESRPLGAEKGFTEHLAADWEYMNYSNISSKTKRSCTEVWSSSTCEKYKGKSNEEIWKLKYENLYNLIGGSGIEAERQDVELYSEMFAINEAELSAKHYYRNKEFSNAVKFLPQTYGYVTHNIESPPASHH